MEEAILECIIFIGKVALKCIATLGLTVFCCFLLYTGHFILATIGEILGLAIIFAVLDTLLDFFE